MRRALLVLFVLAIGCHRRPKHDEPLHEAAHRAEADTVAEKAGDDPSLPPPIDGSPRIGRRPVDFAIYSATPPPAALVKSARDKARRRFPDIDLAAAPPPSDKVPASLIFAPPIETLSLPTEEQLAYFGIGLDDRAVKAAAASKGALVLSWTLDDDVGGARLRGIQTLVAEIAEAREGFIWDETTRQLFTLDAWKEKRLTHWEEGSPPVSQNITIHYYPTEGGRHRAVTLGMVKLGLPDLVVDDLPPSQSSAMTTILDAVGQALAEGATLTKGVLTLDMRSIRNSWARNWLIERTEANNAKLRGHIALSPTRALEGDPENRLLALSFPTYVGATDPERQARAVLSIVGAERDELSGAKAGDPELEAVTARVQARLPALAEQFRNGLPIGQRLSVKAPFDTDSKGTEWMWIEVTDWPGDVLHGNLRNTPNYIEGLHLGAKVETKQRLIVDYVLRNADGTTLEGGESTAILKRRQGGEN